MAFAATPRERRGYVFRVNTLFIVAGLPAAGKTTYARGLANEKKAAFIDIDSGSEPIVKAGLVIAGHDPDDRDSPIFKNAFRIPIYDTLFQIARDNIENIHVVIAGPFTAELGDPTWPEKLAKKLNADIEVHFVACDPEIRRQRMMARGEARDASKLADWNAHLAYYENEPAPACPHAFIDTSGA
ncbi:MAG: hypothetical protein CBD18_00175 [Opitutales bacterium TMED158]|nr:MAG: hypothetical protein CBD18_00175 [Opitutales bacterium TMED158]